MPVRNEHDNEQAYPRHPSPIDCYVGSRIRLRRTLSGISQGQLAAALGLTFQQVQKYENGVNRVGASRLFEISRALNVAVQYFFDDMPPEISNGPFSGRRGGTNESADLKEAFRTPMDDQLFRHETVALVRAYYNITAQTTRELILEIISSLAEPETDVMT